VGVRFQESTKEAIARRKGYTKIKKEKKQIAKVHQETFWVAIVMPLACHLQKVNRNQGGGTIQKHSFIIGLVGKGSKGLEVCKTML